MGRRISLAIIVMYMGSTYLIMSHQLKKNAQAGTEKDLTMVSEKLDMFLERVKSDAILILSSDACQRLPSSADAFQTEDSVADFIRGNSNERWLSIHKSPCNLDEE